MPKTKKTTEMKTYEVGFKCTYKLESIGKDDYYESTINDVIVAENCVDAYKKAVDILAELNAVLAEVIYHVDYIVVHE